MILGGKVGVYGGGAWGTALSCTVARAGREALLYVRNRDVFENLSLRRENRRFLPGHFLEDSVNVTNRARDLSECTVCLLVVPAQSISAACDVLQNILRPGTIVVICAKGIERERHSLLWDIVAYKLPFCVPAILSGPSFASEVIVGLPTALCLAMEDLETSKSLAEFLGSYAFRLYYSDDIVGVEVGGAAKNVLAIACGICEGRQLGQNAKAALMTRGIAEISLLALTLGGKMETLSGLSGIGDIVLTCSSLSSRNFSLGVALGKGENLSTILSTRHAVTEGVWTAPALRCLALSHNVDMPICFVTADILEGTISVENALSEILSRPFRSEAVF